LTKKIDLSGTWNLREATSHKAGRKNIFFRKIPIVIPGDNYSALINQGIIPDPYTGMNELKIQNIAEKDWLFSRKFTLPKDFINDKFIYLNADSIDTCCEIRINDSQPFKHCNMFSRIRIDITDYIKVGENRIDILIRSAQKEAEKLNKKLSYSLPHTIYPVQSMHRNLIRKAQCHGGWDWGPCIMVSGIYGDIYLASSSTGRIEYVTTETSPLSSHSKIEIKNKLSMNKWVVTVKVEYFSYREIDIDLFIQLAHTEITKKVHVNSGVNVFTEKLLIDDIKLWWPSGCGEQNLYELTVKAGTENITKEIGFRTIEVIAEDDEIGRSMIFRVNGRDIFIKGTNWIPMDALPLRETKEHYEQLLRDVVAANMNMVRVWGGGKYESDYFYELCDRFGLLIWQDFMFSCALYPSDKVFLKNVEEEIKHQVKRLKDHPSIALWCGNNEALGALKWFKESIKNRDRYIVDYDRLYEGVIARAVAENDPLRTWWSSSPSGGPQDYSDSWLNDSIGDMHYWSVWHEGKPFESYYDVTPRFCSEFGFQSFPSLSTVLSYADRGDLNLTSPVMEHHQKNNRGNSIIISTVSRYFRFPKSFEQFLYLSQVQQVMAMKMAVEYWRSRRPVCMGTLYWQLNDNWPVASWSSIEYSGKWKLLHYAAKKFYEPFHLSIFVKDEFLQVWGLNDTDKELSGKFKLEFIDFNGSLLFENEVQAVLPPDTSTLLWKKTNSAITFPLDNTFVYVHFKSKTIETDNDIFLTLPKTCRIQKPKININISKEDKLFKITLDTDKPAFFVSLDPGEINGTFSDNCFTLLPEKLTGQKKIIDFSLREHELKNSKGLTKTSLLKRLKVFTIGDNYISVG